MSIEDGFVRGSRNNPGGSRRRSRALPEQEKGFYEEADQPEEGYLDEDYPEESYTDAGYSEAEYLDEDYPDTEDYDDALWDDEPEEEGDLFDDVAIDREDSFQEDVSIAEDQDMEDKIFGQAMDPRRETKGQGAQGNRRQGGSSGRKAPRELNTAGSAVDQKRLKREQEQKKKSRIKKILIWTVVELLTLCCIFAYGYVLRTFSRLQDINVDQGVIENNNLSIEKKKEMEGYWNFYVFGVDGRNSSVGKGLNSDVIMLASINQDTGDIKLVSIFRDTYLNISERNQYNKINQAYALGGPEQAIAALNKNLDLNVTNYVTFNWEAVAHGINILGGVDDIDISSAELYYINAYITETVKATGIGSVQLTHTGPQHLDGVQAVAYARLRLMDTDFARTERQREIIQACFKKAKTADFAVLNNILVDCFPMVAIDIPFADLVRMAQGITRYNIADTAGFPWSRGDANIPKKGACVIPTTLESNVIRLHEFLFGDENYQPSNAVLQYSQKIKEDSNLYKEGKPIESVGTDNGVIQKPKTTAAETDEDEKDDETKERESSREHGRNELFETDEDGNIIFETDEDGEVIYPTDEDGDRIYPTDEDGNRIRPTTGESTTRPSQTRPSETRPGSLMEETEGDAGSEIVDDEGNVLGTSPQPGGSVNSTGSTRPTSIVNPTGSVNPTGGSTRPTSGVNPAGSVNPTTGAAPTAAPETTQSRPTEVISNEPVTPTTAASLQPETTAASPGPVSGGPGSSGPQTAVTPGGGAPGALTPEGQGGPGV